jgi:hypothetical protein
VHLIQFAVSATLQLSALDTVILILDGKLPVLEAPQKRENPQTHPLRNPSLLFVKCRSG